ncbi:hypothetical protein SESBI_33685 [Sesbania bispinosa]|nr:hypothetical protein SESBI_33685 [Sesbania bispinosa]
MVTELWVRKWVMVRDGCGLTMIGCNNEGEDFRVTSGEGRGTKKKREMRLYFGVSSQC